MTIDLPIEIESRLKEEAQRRGVPAEQYATQILLQHLPPTNPVSPANARNIQDLFDQWDEEDYTDDPEEIAKRNAEFEEFKTAINQNRLDSEGPNARKIYP